MFFAIAAFDIAVRTVAILISLTVKCTFHQLPIPSIISVAFTHSRIEVLAGAVWISFFMAVLEEITLQFSNIPFIVVIANATIHICTVPALIAVGISATVKIRIHILPNVSFYAITSCCIGVDVSTPIIHQCTVVEAFQFI
jgi:hypothetical protein